MKVFLVVALVAIVNGAPSSDLVTNLPGLTFPTNYNQYSGYFNGTTGRQLHYWFVESQNDPSTDPVVLWLNGGPGCSSLDGLLSENGPFLTLDDGSGLYENPYAWNKVANMLYLESPACVGFSYDTNNYCDTDDNEVALMNYYAIQQFFTAFSEYSGREFFVTGESYAGIYIPTLSVLIVDGNNDFPINFQGIAIGNGLLNYQLNQDSLMFYGYYHALLGQELWDNLVNNCCGGVEGQDTCDFYTSVTIPCAADIIKAEDIMYYQGLNMYDLYGDCEVSGPPTAKYSKSRSFYDLANLSRRSRIVRPEPYLEVPCINSYPQATWLNQPDVRTALHIPSSVQDWEICSDSVNGNYGRNYNDVSPQLTYLQGQVRQLIYNGDCDMAVNVLGNEWTVTALGFTEIETRKKWEYSNDVAGYVVRYDGLDFVTVRGAGHMVPTDRPGQALQMFTAFINNTPY